jgi:Family of unknown function (DUF5683)
MRIVFGQAYFSAVKFIRIFPLLLMLLFFAGSKNCIAQEQDSLTKKELRKIRKDSLFSLVHSPQKATLYSMVLPGLGQAYNRKYWKIPIVYAGFGTLLYFAINNRNEYIKYRQAYDYSTKGDKSFPINNDYVDRYESDQLLQGRDYYRRNLEFTYILTGLWYVLNIVDAAVDAHLYNYDINDDLTIRFKPVFDYAQNTPKIHPGVSLSFRF